MRTFIDCHTHVFNVVDVPLYLALTDKLKMGTIKRFGAAIGGAAMIPKFMMNNNLLGKTIAGHKEFIMYFERSVDRNIQSIVDGIRDHIRMNPGNTEHDTGPAHAAGDGLRRGPR